MCTLQNTPPSIKYIQARCLITYGQFTRYLKLGRSLTMCSCWTSAGCGLSHNIGIRFVRKMVVIEYKLYSDSAVLKLELDDNDYYDPLENKEETYLNDGVAKHQNPLGYLDINSNNIQWLILQELDKTCRYQYFGQPETFTNNVIWNNGDQEIISSTYLGGDKYHIVRIRTINSTMTYLRDTHFIQNRTKCTLLRRVC